MRIVATLALSVSPVIASAHHSRAHFSDEISELEGELVEIVWRNPHPGFTLRTVGDDGQEELWSMETAALYTLRRGGGHSGSIPCRRPGAGSGAEVAV